MPQLAVRVALQRGKCLCAELDRFARTTAVCDGPDDVEPCGDRCFDIAVLGKRFQRAAMHLERPFERVAAQQNVRRFREDAPAIARPLAERDRGAFEPGGGIFVRVNCIASGVARRLAIRRGALELAGFPKVVRELFGKVARVAAPLDRLCDLEVERTRLRRQHVAVYDIARERMSEGVRERPHVDRIEKLQVAQALERGHVVGDVQAEDLFDQVDPKMASEDRGCAQERNVLLRAPVDALAHDRLQRNRQRVRLASAAGGPIVDRVAKQLFCEERVPARTPCYVVQRIRGQRVALAERRFQELRRLIVPKGFENEARYGRLAQQPAQRRKDRLRGSYLVVAIRRDEKQALCGRTFSQQRQRAEQFDIGPVHVLEQDDAGAMQRDAVERGAYGRKLIALR